MAARTSGVVLRYALVVGAILLAACGSPAPTVTPPLPVATSVSAPSAPTPAPAQPTATSAPALPDAPAEIDFAPLVASIEQEMAAQQVPGLAIAVVHQGAVLFSQGFGVADVATASTVTPATPFRIGSITKPLTAIGLLMLVEAGQVDLDAPVASYLPEFTVSGEITVRQLLSHSGGLGDAAIPYGRTDAGALQAYVAGLTPASAFAPPGEVFSYSNPGFNTIGRIIEVASGMPYADYMTSQVFPLLGIAQTTFNREVALGEGLALGYYPTPGGPQLEQRDPDNGGEFPSGFAFSSVEDLARLAIFLLADGMVAGEQRLSPALVQAMKTPVLRVEPLAMGYGLGLVTRTRNGEAMLGHNGTINGYSAAMEMLPSQELAVIVLSNRNNYDPERIMQAAFDLFGVAPQTPAPEVQPDAAALAEYSGRYRFASAFPEGEGEGMTIAAQGGFLTAVLPNVTFELRPVGGDVFNLYEPQAAAPTRQVAFLRDASGAIRYLFFGMNALPRVAE